MGNVRKSFFARITTIALTAFPAPKETGFYSINFAVGADHNQQPFNGYAEKFAANYLTKFPNRRSGQAMTIPWISET